MRTLGIAIVCCSAMWADVRAQPAHVYAREGEQLAKRGRLAEAIAAFRRADRIETRASHACLIALAYLRSDQPTHAELYLAICEQRASAADPAPEWAPLAAEQLRQQLARARVATVVVRVEPAGFAKIAFPAFADGEVLDPRTVHLPVGRHEVVATMPGREPITQTIEVTGADPQTVTLRFADAPNVIAPASTPSRVPLVIGGVGALTIAAGVAYHVLAFAPTRAELVAASDPANPDPARYDRYAHRFDVRRRVTLGLYGAGAAMTLGGIVLRYTVYRDAPETAPRVSAQITDDGAVVGLEWTR